MDTNGLSNVDTLPTAGTAEATVEHVFCMVCEQEVPLTEALIPEATDYVVYLCGLDCYARWSAAARQAL